MASVCSAILDGAVMSHASANCRKPDRLYLASYTHAPNESTPFPYPSPATRSPHKRSSKSQAGPTPVSSGPRVNPPVYFSVDDTLLYNRFHADFGPLHIGHLYRFAVQLHEVLGDPDNTDRGVVFLEQSRCTESCERGMFACLLHDLDPIVASPLGAGTHSTSGSTIDAFP